MVSSENINGTNLGSNETWHMLYDVAITVPTIPQYSIISGTKPLCMVPLACKPNSLTKLFRVLSRTLSPGKYNICHPLPLS